MLTDVGMLSTHTHTEYNNSNYISTNRRNKHKEIQKVNLMGEREKSPLFRQ